MMALLLRRFPNYSESKQGARPIRLNSRWKLALMLRRLASLRENGL
jgi:hypothetical protein